MSLTAAASGFVFLLLSAQVVQSQNGWGVTYTSTEICAPTGSTVEMNCSITYPSRHNPYIRVTKTFWHTVPTIFWHTRSYQGEPVDLKTDYKYKDRVQHSCSETNCTLTLSDLRKRDSAVYQFRFLTKQPDDKYSGYPGVTLTVTDLQVTIGPYWLRCDSSCYPPQSSYVWYQNGQKIQNQNGLYLDSFDSQDSFSCAFKEHVDSPSPSVCLWGQNCNRLTYTDRSICASKGSSVNISCIYNKYNHRDASTFWFRKNPEAPEDLQKDSQFKGRADVETVRGRSTLTLSNLTERDSAEYHFKFKTPNSEWSSSPGTALTVTELQVQVIRVRQSDNTVELSCLSSCSPAGPSSFIWIKNGEKITERETRTYSGRLGSGEAISCALKGHEQFPSPSVYAPRLPSVSVSPSAEIVEGSSVTLTCSSDANPAASYTWFKENQTLISKDPQLVFSSIQSSDSGEYHCEAENQLGRWKSEYKVIDVKYPPRLPSVSVSPSAEIVEGSSVNLTCSSDANPAASYTWFKENRKVLQDLKNLYLSSVSFKDSGWYHCKSENKYGEMNSTSVHVDVQYAPRLPSVSVSPSAEIVEGSSVNLTCSSDANPAASYTWFKEDEDSPRASGQIFTITDLTAEHGGNYYCEAWNSRGRQNSTLHLTVKAGPMKSVALGSFTAVFLALIFLAVFFLIRRKRMKQTSEGPDNIAQANVDAVYESPSAPVQRRAAEQQDELCYATVSFSKNHKDTLYSNIRLAQPVRHKSQEEEEDVQYSTVNIRRAPASTESKSQKAAEDPSELYSTVFKKPRV